MSSSPIPTLPGATSNATLFHAIFATLSSKTPTGLQARTASWSQADPNGNSYISLAEMDSFLLQTLKVDHGENKGTALHAEYRPAYLLAFNRSKKLAPNQKVTAKSTGDDYITKREFRMFFVNLLFHVLALDCFAVVDGGGAGVTADDDRRITLKEMEEAAPTIAKYGFVGMKEIGNVTVEALFKQMDTNGGGFVLLNEFCAYLIAKEVEGKTDMGKELDVEMSVAAKSTPVKKKKSGGTGGGSVPHFMSPTASAASTKAKGSAPKPASKAATPKRTSRRPPPSAPTSAAKAKSTPTKGRTKTAANITPSKKKPIVADPSAPKFRKPGPSADLQLFTSTFAPLIDLKDPHAKKDRAAAWKKADPNGNNVLSLAEVDSWIQTTLVAQHRQLKGRQLYKLYRPAYILSFDAAKSLAEGGNDDYVTKKEFRLMVAYLTIYAELQDAFAALDGGGPGVDANDDRRISREEWTKGHHTVSTYDWTKLHKLTDAEAEAVFDEMDTDGGGMVLLNEWCDYLIRAEVRAGTETGVLLSKVPKYSSIEGGEVKSVYSKMTNEEKQKKAMEAEADAEAKKKAEAERLEKERLEKERAAAAKSARLEEEKRLEAERVEAARVAKAEEAARQAEEARVAEVKRLEEERLAAEEAARQAEEARIIAEAKRLEEERIEADRLAEEARIAEEKRLEEERLAAEEAARLAEEKRLEEERIAAEKVRIAEEKRQEEERLAAEEAARLAAEKRLEEERIAAEEAELKALEEEERRIAEEEAELKKLEEEEAQLAAEQVAEEAKILEQKALEAERLNDEIQNESSAPEPNQTQTKEEPVASLASSLQKAAPFASSLRAAAGSSLAAAAAKATSLAEQVKEEMNKE